MSAQPKLSATERLNLAIGLLDELDDDTRDEVVSVVQEGTADMSWFPNPGPQTECEASVADEVFLGGSAGGGKSSLINGIAYNNHERSLLLRRYRTDAEKLAEQELIEKILSGDRSRWNGSKLLYRDDNRKKVIQFGGCENEADKQRFKGTPYDFYGFDEITDFTYSQYIFITIWNRSATPGQRCRIVCTGNPPTDAKGLWVIRHWAPWLDPKHPNPAKPGELRWYIRNDEGDEVEVPNRGPHRIGLDMNGEPRYVEARSRTFIPASLADNPDLAADGEYERSLNLLPKDLRDAYRDGKFDASLKDNPGQVIPTFWIQAAMERWKNGTRKPPEGVPMCAIGLDVAGGGEDDNVLTPRYDHWFGEQEIKPGVETPLGVSQGPWVTEHRRDGCYVNIDCGGGYGGTCYADLKQNEYGDNDLDSRIIAYKGSESPHNPRTKDGLLMLETRRAEVYWKMREALDPSQPGGSLIELPDDPELLAQLTALTYEVHRNTIKMKTKVDLVADLGYSPDKADSLVLANDAGPKIGNFQTGQEWSHQYRQTTVNRAEPAAHRAQRRRRGR